MRIIKGLILSSLFASIPTEAISKRDGMKFLQKHGATHFVLEGCKKSLNKCRIHFKNNYKLVAKLVPYNKHLATKGMGAYKILSRDHQQGLMRGSLGMGDIASMADAGEMTFMRWMNSQKSSMMGEDGKTMNMGMNMDMDMGMSGMKDMKDMSMDMDKDSMRNEMKRHHKHMGMKMDSKKRRKMRMKNMMRKAKVEGLLREALKELSGMDYIPVNRFMMMRRHMMMKKMGMMKHGEGRGMNHMHHKMDGDMGHKMHDPMMMDRQMNPDMMESNSTGNVKTLTDEPIKDDFDEDEKDESESGEINDNGSNDEQSVIDPVADSGNEYDDSTDTEGSSENYVGEEE